jgi:hypothetical protein
VVAYTIIQALHGMFERYNISNVIKMMTKQELRGIISQMPCLLSQSTCDQDDELS